LTQPCKKKDDALFCFLHRARCLDGLARYSLRKLDVRGRHVVVANRASGDITLISDGGDAFNVTLEGPVTPEPMYVSVYGRDVYVGDRANDRIIKFADADFDATPTYIDSCGGIFHMWNNGVQLWVSCNVDNAVDVIDLATATVVQTIDVNSTGVPHDIVATAGKGFATIFVQNDADKILSFETATFAPVDELTVGEDPHVGVMAGSTTLVSCFT
jgi:DNA-binding beta-propeller fold protein YncE